MHYALKCRKLPQKATRMARKTEKKTRITISITPDEKRRLEEIAHRSEISLSRVAQEAVKQFITGQSGKVGLFGPRTK